MTRHEPDTTSGTDRPASGAGDDRAPIVVVLGTTGSGKTELAIRLAESLPEGGECLSADSMQIYRGMNVGTAKATAAERARVAHHLIDLVDPDDDGFTVADWLSHAERTIAEVRARGRRPIVVGGTNLYLRALIDGVCDAPPADRALRASFEALDDATLRARLESVDPSAAGRIHPNDRRRTIRALEVHAATGETLSERQREWADPAGFGRGRADVVLIGITRSTESANRRINARVKAMMDTGFLDEVRGLRAADAFGTQSRQAVGYVQLLAHLDGHCSLAEAVEQIKIRTRRYAKQQRTWLRRFRTVPGSVWLDGDALDDAELLARAHDHVVARSTEPPTEQE